jgi:hypothetical protein
MFYKYTSSQPVIYRIKKIIKDSGWLGDALMYIGDGVQLLGYNLSTEVKVTSEDSPLEIENHIAYLPCGLEEIIKVEYLGTRLPYNNDVSINGLNSSVVSADQYIWNKNGEGNWYSLGEMNIIRTSFEEGEVKLFYKAFKIDNDGFPYIPDSAQYRNALLWYVVSMLLLEGYKTGDPRIDHKYADSQYKEWKEKARSRGNSMSRDKRMAFTQMWTSLNIQDLEIKLQQAP